MGCIKFNSPEGQTILIGLIFFFVFIAYEMMQGYFGKLYGSTIGSDIGFTIYALFTVSSLFAAAVTNILGCKITIFIGILGYACLVIFSLIYFESGMDEKYVPLVMMGSGFLGIGAGLLWTAQGRLMLQYSNDNDAGYLFSIFWGIFNCSAVVGGLITYEYFSDSSAKGGSAGDVSLFVIFLAFIFTGAFLVFFLRSPRDIRRNLTESSSREDNCDDAVDMHSIELRKLQNMERSSSIVESSNNTNGGMNMSSSLVNKDNEIVFNSEFRLLQEEAEAAEVQSDSISRSCSTAIDTEIEISNINTIGNGFGVSNGAKSWKIEIIDTFHFYFTPRMQMLFFIVFQTGFAKPYQLITFGNRFLSEQALGIILSIFFLAEVIGGVFAGRILDSVDAEAGASFAVGKAEGEGQGLYPYMYASSTSNLQWSWVQSVYMRRIYHYIIHRSCLWWAVVTAGGGYTISAAFEIESLLVSATVREYGMNSNWVLMLAVCFFAWGLSDAYINGFIYWHIQQKYPNGEIQSRAVSFFKMVSSLGWCVGFLMVPTYRCPAAIQLLSGAVILVTGMLCLYWQLNADRTDLQHESASASGGDGSSYMVDQLDAPTTNPMLSHNL